MVIAIWRHADPDGRRTLSFRRRRGDRWHAVVEVPDPDRMSPAGTLILFSLPGKYAGKSLSADEAMEWADAGVHDSRIILLSHEPEPSEAACSGR